MRRTVSESLITGWMRQDSNTCFELAKPPTHVVGALVGGGMTHRGSPRAVIQTVCSGLYSSKLSSLQVYACHSEALNPLVKYCIDGPGAHHNLGRRISLSLVATHGGREVARAFVKSNHIKRLTAHVQRSNTSRATRQANLRFATCMTCIDVYKLAVLYSLCFPS